MNASPKIAIVGLGYVGLPLAIQFASHGVFVFGLDTDPVKVTAINGSRSYISHVSETVIAGCIQNGKLWATNDFSKIQQVDAVIICVPTPLNKYREPDLSFVLETGKTIAPYLQRDMVVVLESTTYPGTTEGELREVLEAGSNLGAGRDFSLAYSPEREDPGNPASRVGEVPKLIGGLTPQCLEAATAIYGLAQIKLVPCSSAKVAEAAKLLENIFRSVNIAMVNELKIVYAAMGIDIWEVIEAAKSKPFGFMPFYPGPGLGGHCIPIDPFYLTWKAREFGQHTRFIELAGEINTSMPEYVVERIAAGLNAAYKPVNDAKILIVGLAYKAGVDDERESPSYRIMDLLAERGARISYYDPFIPRIRATREHARWAGTESIQWKRKTISQFDAVVIATAQTDVNYFQLALWAKLIIDTRNRMATEPNAIAKVWKA